MKLHEQIAAILGIAALFLGLGLTFAAYDWFARAARAQLEQQFADSVRAQLQRLRGELTRHVEVLDDLAEAIAASPDGDPSRFAQAAQSIPDIYAGLTALAWVPRVPHAGRATHEADAQEGGQRVYAIRERGADGSLRAAAVRSEYFPVRLMEPEGGRETELGFDLGSEPSLRAALIRARDSGRPAATPPKQSIEARDSGAEVLVFYPVYRGGGKPTTIEERVARLRGYAAGVLHVQPLLTTALREETLPLAVVLVDRNNDAAHAALASFNERSNSPTAARLRRQESADLAGRRWTVDFAPTDAFLRAHASNEPLLALLIGLGLTTAVLVGLIVMRGAHERALALASRSQSQLAASQARETAILDNMAEALVLLDAQGVVRMVNSAAVRLFGWPAGDLVGRHVDSLLRGVQAMVESFTMGAERVHASDSARELKGMRRDGSEFPATATLSSLPRFADARYVVVIRDLTAEKRVDRALRLVVQGAAGTTGLQVFDAITRSLAEALGVQFAFVAELVADGRARTASAWLGHEHIAAREYALAGTPCEQVIGHEACVYPDGIQERFPGDAMLVAMNARSYVGQPLVAADGEALGVLAILDTWPMHDTSLAQSLLGLVGPRVSAELERIRADNALLQSRERLELAVEGSKLALWDLNLVTREVFLSAGWSRMMGNDAGNTVTTLDRLYGSVHPEDVAAVDRTFKNTLTGVCEFYDVTHRVARSEGSWVWVRSHGKVTKRDASGRALRMVGTNADITWEKIAETELASRELELRTVCDNIPANIARFDRHLRYRYTNSRNAALLGQPPQEIVGKPLLDVVGETTFRQIGPYFEKALMGEMVSFDRHIERAGKPLWLEVTLFPDIDAKRAVQGCFLVSWDVTQRVLAEHALKSSMAVLERTIANLPVGVSVTDANLNFVAFNELFPRLLDLPAQFLRVGDSLERVFRFLAQRGDYGPGDIEEIIGARLARARNFEPLCVERVRADKVAIEIQGVPVPSGGYVRLVTDVTARKAFERSLVEAREHAEAAARAKSEFLATMSHEIRTPMNGVLGLAQLLLDGELGAEQRGYAETLHRSGHDLLGILNDILDLSKIEANKLTLEPIAFDVAESVRDVVKLLGAKSSQKNLELTLTIDQSCPPILVGDPGRIRQVLGNLVGNAIKFTESGQVAVQVTCCERDAARVFVQFSVADTGIGIAPSARERLFQPFMQADNSTTRRFGGTGLGLAICKRLIDLMGGEIDVESAPGEGSRFWFRIPLAVRERPDERAADQPHAPLPVAEGAQRFHGRILLVEDNQVNRKVAGTMLRKLGLEVAEAFDGAQALERFASERFDLIFMDVHMPVMDGLAATRAIRARANGSGAARVPIVALTANASAEARVICEAAGMDDFIAKPFVREQLLAVLERWLGVTNAQRDAPCIEQVPHAASAESTLDRERLESLSEAMGEDFADLVEAFQGTGSDILRAMDQAWRAADMQVLHRHAHTLKSSSANLGATALAALAKRMEADAKRGTVDDAQVRFGAMVEEFGRVCAALEQFCAHVDEGRKAA